MIEDPVCRLVAPMSLMVGIGKGTENGILIRSGEAFQTSQALKTVVSDANRLRGFEAKLIS